MLQSLRPTERLDPASAGIDACATGEVLTRLLDGQMRAARSVEAVVPAIERAVDLGFTALSRGGRIAYLAAGSPALMALADALEIPQTFNENADRFVTLLAGAADILTRFGGEAEDDEEAAIRAVAQARIGPDDCLVAISASGSTPFVRAGLGAARRAGAATVAIANNPDAPILLAADVAVFLDTGPEVVAGSTRMGAGTAQKIVLNMLSTALAVRRGHVHDGHMVGVRADNAKLRQRAIRMIGDTTGASPRRAAEVLRLAGGEVKPAILLAAGVADPAEARRRLVEADGNLRRAVEGLADGMLRTRSSEAG